MGAINNTDFREYGKAEEQTQQENYGGEFSPQTDTVPAEASTGEDVEKKMYEIIKGEIT